MSHEVYYEGSPFFSYGFRPFFLSAALFAGIAVPLWVFILTGIDEVTFHYPPREWHVHEMVFGFLPCVITGFILTALPNWTDRSPLRGLPLVLLVLLWGTGRLVIAIPWFPPLSVAIIDGAFLVVVASVVFREIAIGRVWNRLPIGILLSVYASANILFHVLLLNDKPTDLAERMALSLVMILLALIGGRITPSFTEDYFLERSILKPSVPFSLFDGLSIMIIVVAAISWILNPQGQVTGWLFLAGGAINLIRLTRWQGWVTWREPLVLILHVGYGWLGVSLLLLGGAILAIGLPVEDAIHALTTGAVGVMTLAVMTRASLGHTGRAKLAGSLTIIIFLLVNLGAVLRVFGPSLALSGDSILALAGGSWSGAYLLFAIGYGHILFGGNLADE